MESRERVGLRGLPMPPTEAFHENLFRQLLSLAGAIHHTEGRLQLYLQVVAIILVVLATAIAQIVLNAWNRPFYDAIQNHQVGAFVHQLLVFCEIAAVLLILNVSQTGLSQSIRLKLRELATLDLIRNWQKDKRASRITRAGEIGVNPDQRIHEDTRHLTEVTTDLGVGLLQSSLLLVSFIGVLWELSRSVVFHIAGNNFVIPGYMVWAALAYAITGSLLSWRIGWPLVQLSTTRYAREADFRVTLVRGNEQADGIALNGGEAEERRLVEAELARVLTVMRKIVIATIRLTFVTSGYGWGALVIPIIVAAPAYFGGSLSFGELMMVVGAFNQVQQALRWFVDNTGTIADWRATLFRVMNFRHALLNLDRFEQGIERFERVRHPTGGLAFDDLHIMNFNGEAELSEAHVDIKPGEHVLIVGKPGSGKSTLFLSIAGLWNWGTGRISLPPVDTMMFLSQRSFLPPGTLRSILNHTGGRKLSDSELGDILTRVGIGQLATSLDRVERWDRDLNSEELQRVILARMLVNRPAWVISDEAIDVMDDASRQLILSIFSKELAGSALVSIGSRSTGNGFYTRILRLTGRSTGESVERAAAE